MYPGLSSYVLFSGPKVKDVQLPRERDRLRGFGYAEFEDRESLISALSLSEEKLKGRAIKVNLAEDSGKTSGLLIVDKHISNISIFSL